MRIAPKKYCVVDLEFQCLFVEAYGLKEAKRRAEEASRKHEAVFGEKREYVIMTPEQEAACFAKWHGGAVKRKQDALKRKRPPAVRLAA